LARHRAPAKGEQSAALAAGVKQNQCRREIKSALERTMRRKVTAWGWRFPLRMTRKQWSMLPYAERHTYVAQAQCNLLGYWRDCATPGAMLPLSASLLLGSQAGHDAG
jgi:hypothetical protein